jgi:cyclopropane fatty-acyl-phospholipid synthase-like methyltransferase
VTQLEPTAYNFAVFDARTIAEAKEVILTPEGMSSEARWQHEAPYLMRLLAEHIGLDENSLVIDYGCGIGRMAKALIGEYGCRVVGIDISASMRALAASYVGSDRFFTCSSGWLRFFAPSELWRPDAALSIWTLQHCFNPQEDIAAIDGALAPGGRLFVVNNDKRVVPVEGGRWADDGKNIGALLEERFSRIAGGRMDDDAISEELAKVTFWGVYQKWR